MSKAKRDLKKIGRGIKKGVKGSIKFGKKNKGTIKKIAGSNIVKDILKQGANTAIQAKMGGKGKSGGGREVRYLKH